jgi:hypothetical protein
MPAYHLAQLNIGRSVAPMDDARMAGFATRLDEINALAERSPGYVWRLQGDNGNATELKYFDDPLVIINLTMWETVDDLHAFTYRSDHKGLFARRFDWFERWNGPSMVLWWQAAGTVPDAEEAFRRLRHLADHGPTPEAFTFKQRFPPPDPVQAPLDQAVV